MALVPFIAYGEGTLIYASLDIARGRLTDFLNERDELMLTSVVLQDLADGRTVEIAELTLSLGDVYAIEASGPRGPEQRRIRTRMHRLELNLGEYEVLGHLHAVPGAEPIEAMARRKAMIPLTAATIAFHLAGSIRMRDMEALIINRHNVVSVRSPAHVRERVLNETIPLDPRALDLTGYLLTDRSV